MARRLPILFLLPLLAATALRGLEGPDWSARQSAEAGLARTVSVLFGGELEGIWSAEDCSLVEVRTAPDEARPDADRTRARSAPLQPQWLLRAEVSEQELSARFRGYRRSGDDLVLDCSLGLADGSAVWVEEVPSLVHDDEGVPGLQRAFRTYDVPTGRRVWTDVSIDPRPLRKHLRATGDLELRNRQKVVRKGSQTEAELGLLASGTTRLEVFFPAGAGPILGAPDDSSELSVGTLAAHSPGDDDGTAPELAETDLIPATASTEPGLSIRVWNIGQPMITLHDVDPGLRPNYATVIAQVDLDTPEDFGGPRDLFRTTLAGFLEVSEPGSYELRLVANDGAALWIDERKLIEHEGAFSTHAQKVRLDLETGSHALRIEHFDNVGGQLLRLEWISPSLSDFELVPASALRTEAGLLLTAPGPKKLADERINRVPGNGLPPAGVHPGFELQTTEIRGLPAALVDLHYTPERRLLAIEEGGRGRVFAAAGAFAPAGASAPASSPSAVTVASGLRDPLALVAVGRQVFVLEDRELVQLVDVTGDGVADEYWTFATGWTDGDDPGAHGALGYSGGDFLARLQDSTRSAAPDRSRALRVSSDGSWQENVALENEVDLLGPTTEGGLFTALLGEDDREAATRSVNSAPMASSGAYAGQSIVALEGRLVRLAPEEVGGRLQGAVLPFSTLEDTGLGTDTARHAITAADGAVLVHTGSSSSDRATARFVRLAPNGETPFEISTVSAKNNGLEVTLTEPLGGNAGWEPTDYRLERHSWVEDPLDEERLTAHVEALPVLSASVSGDRRRIFLETGRQTSPSLIHLRLTGPFVGTSGRRPWTAEAWYSLIEIPDELGEVRLGPILSSPNTLTESERGNRWRLLFDGESLKGWRGYRRSGAPSAWRVEDGLLTLGTEGERGDLITESQFAGFELVLEWAVTPDGNSGVLYRVRETSDESYWTGPEYQILDTAPDDSTEPFATGANYALHAPRYPAAREALRFNTTRIVVDDGRVEHWLNGYLVVEYELGSDDWKARVAESKFADRSGYGRSSRGHIGLQDHGSEVWFRSIKLREL